MQGIPRRIKLLEKHLADLPEENEPMLVSELDGYLAGILVCPELIPPSEWLPLVWGGDDDESAPVFADVREARKVVELVMEHYNAVATTLHQHPGEYAPLLEVDTRHDEVLWELWIDGFQQAMQLRPGAWARLFDADEDTRSALAGLITLAQINQAESDLSPELVEKLTDEAPDLIPYWVAALSRWQLGKQPTPLMSQVMSAAKTGRNDPCSCGSGKKYKKCCGLN